ncbi:MAG: Cna B-type domain-containing protein, partial [Anaerovoracaceae bacterium]
MRRKFMAWIMSIMMIATMMPTMAFAEGGSAKDSPYQVTDHGGGGLDGGLYMSKTLDKIDKDGKGTITLETYVKGKIETSSTPMDIVLVLDVSGSMDDPIGGGDDTKKIDALKSSVNSFIDSVSADASTSKNGVDHKISIVKFAGKKSNRVGNDTYNEWRYKYNYSQIVQNLTDVRNGGAAGLKTKVNSLSAAGATAADYGMQLANTEISKSTSADRNRVVIMFTDGEPNHQNGFDGDVANAAISASKNIKAKNIAVYTIGMFDDADSSDFTGQFNKYMHYVSSNYPNATSMKNGGERIATPSFYKTAKNASELEAIFEEISSESKDTELDESTIVRDVMSEYFETDDSAGDIKIYEAEYKGNDQFGEKTQITGGALSKYTVTADSGQVSVKGFDFEAVMDTPKVKGKKLIIEIPVKLKDSTISNESLSGKTIPSNNTDSAKSSIIKTTEPAQSWNFEIPKVKLPVAKTDISGTKTWVDDSNADNTRPDSITLKLYRNIKGGDKTEVTGVTPTWTKNGNTWTYEYKDLPKTDADGNVYTYTVKEELAATSPYEAKYDGNNITNSLKSGTTDFSGEKVWKDSDGKPIDNSKLPASIEIELLQNGESMTPVQKQTVTPGADNKWTYTFTGLPKYDKDGKRYQYSTKEHIDGYISGIDTSTGELTNTYNGGTTSYVVEKAWSDSENHPASVTVQLKQDGEAYGGKVTLNSVNNWKHEYTNLPKYKKDGSKYKYSVEEDAVPGYESTQTELKDSNGRVIGTKITNKFADEKTKYTVKKEWSDPANHPGSIKIQLKQDGKAYGDKVTLNESNNWSHEYTDLPKYKKDGSKYKYSVEEDAVPGYESTQT